MHIHHSVFFKLKYSNGSPEEKAFFTAARGLANIPDVHNFQCLKQISKKNSFEFGLSMEFESQQHYDTYNNHPLHIAFVQDYFLPAVEDFSEVDYLVLT